MNLPETRLKVELISATTPYHCCTEQYFRVTSLYHDLPNDEATRLVRLCGFYGQEVKVVERKQDEQSFVKVVRVFCDSGD